ncbi:heme NO-binding domain-containing protein [Magnetococcales bacterium HHB-1]
MYGLILQSFNDFAKNELKEQWDPQQIIDHLDGKKIQVNIQYPDHIFHDILQKFIKQSELSYKDVLGLFGVHIAPSLVEIGTFLGLLKEEWGLFDLITHANDMVHKVLRSSDPEIKPPEIRILRFSNTELNIYYDSHRRLCPFLIGIVHGLAKHFGENVTVDEHRCMLEASPFCSITVKQQTVSEKSDWQERFQFIFRNSGLVYLFNTFKGIPISFPAQIQKVTETEVICSVHAFQRIAMNEEKSTQINSQFLTNAFRAEVSLIDSVTNTATLASIQQIAGNVGYRRFVRIQTSKEISVECHLGGLRLQDVFLDEISLGGVVLSTSQAYYEQIKENLHHEVRARFNLPVPHMNEDHPPITLWGRVLRTLKKEQAQVALVVEIITMHATNHSIIQQYVTKQQMEVLNALAKIIEEEKRELQRFDLW